MSDPSRSNSTFFHRLVGIALGILLFLPTFAVAFAEAGAGHGTYFSARLFFPFWILFAALIDGLPAASSSDIAGLVTWLLICCQYPVYGAFIGGAWYRNRKRTLRAVILVHLSATAISFVFEGATPW